MIPCLAPHRDTARLLGALNATKAGSVLAIACLLVGASACGGRSQMTSTTPAPTPPTTPSTSSPGGGSGSNGGGSAGGNSGTPQSNCAAVPIIMAQGPQTGVAPFPDSAPANPA